MLLRLLLVVVPLLGALPLQVSGIPESPLMPLLPRLHLLQLLLVQLLNLLLQQLSLQLVLPRLQEGQRSRRN